ncbi:MAG: response regulator [Candidatus Latescibacteria bacterium]|nr:response regulator [Candidatus Latescibacterota bacterium]NIO56274.1 response regulator [Candidatus Latescibacterota bacterium]
MKTKVLILDDEQIVGERLKASLELAGFTVDAFSSSREALQKLEEESYDILVTDLKMSGPDGMEVLRAARQMRPGIKSVVITGFATKDTAEEAMRSGAVKFIAKPFKMSDLKKLLMTLSGIIDNEDPSGSNE